MPNGRGETGRGASVAIVRFPHGKRLKHAAVGRLRLTFAAHMVRGLCAEATISS